MKRLVPLFSLLLCCVSCATSEGDAHRWPRQEPFASIAWRHTAISSGYSWTLEDSALSVVRHNSDTGVPSVLLHQRALSRSEFSALISAVKQSGLLSKLGTTITHAPQYGEIMLSDFVLISFSFDKHAAHSRTSTVTFVTRSDRSADVIIDAMNALLPEEFHFRASYQAEPNKAPEPTPMSVTPRANARVAPAIGVAHR